MKIAIVKILILSLFISCSKKTVNDSDGLANEIIDNKDYVEISLTTDEILEIKKHIELQKRGDSDDMTERDIELGSQLIKKMLIQQGYKIPSGSDYSKRLMSIFKIDAEHLSKDCKLKNHDNFFVYLVSQGDDQIDLKETEYDYTYDHIFFIKNDNFITRVLYLEDFVNEIKNNKVKMNVDLKIVHINKFLFNDNQSSLVWLIDNDLEFLKRLVCVSGYDKNEKVNEAVLTMINKEYLSEQPKNKEILENVFARKNCEGSLEISDNMMKYIANTSKKEYETPLDMLYDCASFMADINSDHQVKFASKFSKKERFKIAAYAGYYEQLARDKNNIDNPESSLYSPTADDWYPGSFIRNELVGNKEFLQEIIINDYYGLPGYKEIIESVLNKIEEDSNEYQRTHQ